MMDNIVVDIKEEPAPYGADQCPVQEEYTVSDMLFIEDNEIFVLENKDVHMKAIIRNKGRLEFRNCTIHYGEEDVSDEIHLDNKQAEVTAVNCTFICHSSDAAFFINGENGGSAFFDECTFEDCLYFAGKMSNIRMHLCRIHNCGPRFVSCSYGSNCVIAENEIIYDSLADHLLIYVKKNQDTYLGAVFCCYHQEADIQANTVTCDPDFYSRYQFDHAIFGVKGDSVAECLFTKVRAAKREEEEQEETMKL